jgi:hypothetical protein
MTDTVKFDRLAARLKADSAEAKDKLRKKIASEAAPVHEYVRLLVTPSPWGLGRIDALTLIADRLTSILPGISENWAPAIAPVKPPFLWNAPQGLWTQWGTGRSDPIVRNLSEVMGVFMPIDFDLQNTGRRSVPIECCYPRAHASRGPTGTFGAAKLAGRSVRQA